MTTTAKSRPVVRVSAVVGPAVQAPAVPSAVRDQLRRIDILGKQIATYVHFMCQVGGPNAASAEATEQAVTAFHEQLIIAESQLRRIHDELRLA